MVLELGVLADRALPDRARSGLSAPTVEFGGHVLLAAPGVVMTPRATSLAAVGRVLAHIGSSSAVVVDVGTGSGAIAIAVAHAARGAHVYATDVSEPAVALARANVERCRVRVTVLHGDLLDPVAGRVDVIVANLPYLPRAERASHPELAAEPEDAVFGDGDGLDAYRRLRLVARDRLNEGGLLVLQLRDGLEASSRAALR